MVFAILWRFQPKPEKKGEFEEAYGPAGIWARFFEKGEGFLGTELFLDVEESGQYVTIDRWQTRAQYESFAREYADEYQEIDERLDLLTDDERLGGSYEVVGSSPSG